MTPPQQDKRPENSYLSTVWGWVSSLNLGRLALSFFLACFLWLIANYQSGLEKDVEIPINYLNLPGEFVISNSPYLPGNAKLRIKGTRSQVSAVLKTNTAINIDLQDEEIGVSTHLIRPESVSLPRNVRIVRMSPREVVLDIDAVLEKFVSVRPDVGEPAPGYYVEGQAQSTPSTVRIKGPRKIIHTIKEVMTSLIPIDKETSTFSVDIGLVSPDSHVEFSETKTVKATVNIVEVKVEKTFQSLKVEMREIPKEGKYEIEPQTADIKFYGPKSLIDALHSDDIQIYVDARSAANLKEGKEKNILLKYSYPQSDRIRVTEVKPQSVTIKKERTEK